MTAATPGRPGAITANAAFDRRISSALPGGVPSPNGPFFDAQIKCVPPGRFF